MYPQCPLPRHITALYVVAVASCVALFSHGVALVGADVLVYAVDFRDEPQIEFKDLPARFGDSLPLEGLKGLVVSAKPENACTEIAPPPQYPNYFGKWIVLIRRYGCSFEDKVRAAQNASYSAAIVYNVNSSELEPMSAKNPYGIFIPSVFVGEKAGVVLKEDYQYMNSYYVLINDDLPFNINTHLLLPFAIVVGICFLIMVVFMVVKCIKDRRRQRRHRLPNSSLRKIPTAKFSKGDPYETCAICLEDYQEGEKLRILPCSHAYHSKCIDPWLTRNRRVCPVCKRKVFAQGEQVTETESESDTDDTTPLVRPSSYGTQGGTFVPQRENPFQRAARRQQRSGSLSSSTSSGTDSSESNSTTATNGSSSNTEARNTAVDVPGLRENVRNSVMKGSTTY
ncbi:E3 ubiquitin-protein ligase RNF13 isoform X2 [Periplaneta americana]|uniref:E3 ubiquitin-protein ligase RNF13 isoform X2 n=1 Tax=Periplaneta americana TaxID=6978 RepID=UPI0037E987F1